MTRRPLRTTRRPLRSVGRKILFIGRALWKTERKDGQTWLAFARGFAVEAVPLAEEFVGRGMAPDFIDDLKARILKVDGTTEDRVDETDQRIGSTAALSEAARQGFEAVRELAPIVRNVYAGNEAELAAWESASHVERAPRHDDEEEEEEPPAPPAPASN